MVDGGWPIEDVGWWRMVDDGWWGIADRSPS